MNAKVHAQLSDASAPSAGSSPLRDHYDVVIVGGSIAGCATAQSLSLADPTGRRKILCFDLHPEVSPRFAGEMIHPRGAQVLEELGFYGPLKAAGGVDVEGFCVSEHADAEPVVLDYASIPGRPSGFSAHHKLLVRGMRKIVSQRDNVDMRGGYRLVELMWTPDNKRVIGVVLQTKDKRLHRVRADLVVGADGKASTTRKLAEIPGERQSLGFTVGLTVQDPAVPNPLRAHVILGAPGPMLCYPIARDAEGHLTSRLTFDLPHALPAKGRKISDYLLDAFVPYLPGRLAGQVAAAIESRVAQYGRLEMAPTVNLPAPLATRPGVALVGDAAGCSHPITASGMTMGLLDAHFLGVEAKGRTDRPAGEPWLDEASLRRYRIEHGKYVPTRQALADAIYEAFRGTEDGARAIRRALFSYWQGGERNRQRSLALLACSEGRPHVFLAEYLRTARHAVESSLVPRHAQHFPVSDRLRQMHSAMGLASDKFGLVAQVAWAQIRPEWMI